MTTDEINWKKVIRDLNRSGSKRIDMSKKPLNDPIECIAQKMAAYVSWDLANALEKGLPQDPEDKHGVG